MSVYVYGQDRGKYHMPRDEKQVEETRPYRYRVRTYCGQQLDEAFRTFMGYAHPKVKCRHCFPPREVS